MEFLSLIMEGSTVICKKNHVFIEEDNPSNKVVTMEEALYYVKVDRIGNFVNLPRLLYVD